MRLSAIDELLGWLNSTLLPAETSKLDQLSVALSVRWSMRIVLPEATAVALPVVTNAVAADPHEPATQGIGRSPALAARPPPNAVATNAATVPVRSTRADRACLERRM